MKIVIETIPMSEQRYPTVGDWWHDPDGTIQVRVSAMSDPRYEFLVARHELDELFLCYVRGIKEKDVTDFDLMFEHEREQGLHKLDEEPGFDPRAPYLAEHTAASAAERIMATELDVDWAAYDNEVNSL